MKTYSFEEAKTLVHKEIKASVNRLRQELRAAKKKPAKAYVSRSV